MEFGDGGGTGVAGERTEEDGYQQASAEKLIEHASQMREKANNELGKIAVEILAEEQK